MKKSLAAVILLFVTCLALAQPAPMTPATRDAITQIVNVLNVGQAWPSVIKDVCKKAASTYEKAAMEGLRSTPGLTAKERKKYRKLLPEYARLMAAEIETGLLGIDAHAMSTAMILEIYPKYYTAAEIEMLARFYSHAAYRKSHDIRAQIHQEAAATGKPARELWPKYATRLTSDDLKMIQAFTTSSAARREQEVATALEGEQAAFMEKWVAELAEKEIDKGLQRLQDKFAAER